MLPKNKPSRKPRTERLFPAMTFEEVLALAKAIQEHAGGQKVRRLILFEKMDQPPDNSDSRRLITASNQYGLTKGSYKAEFLELTPLGSDASGEDVAAPKKVKARFELAINKFEPFKALYEQQKNSKVPAKEVMMDFLRQREVPEEQLAECVDTFVLNVKFLRLLRTIAGSERLVSLEQVLDEASTATGDERAVESVLEVIAPTDSVGAQAEPSDDFSKICFYITPIGDVGSEQRRHADFMMEYIIVPAIKEFGLKVVRADQMSKPGMIGKQVIEHILKSKLVVADLSFHNPNVFYELCLRHTTRLPTVQLKREVDSIPFDVNQYRTIPIETRDPYTLLPKIQTYTSQVTNQVRRALQDAESGDNPISLYYPAAKLVWDTKK
jgi:hypothetical protein